MNWNRDPKLDYSLACISFGKWFGASNELAGASGMVQPSKTWPQLSTHSEQQDTGFMHLLTSFWHLLPCSRYAVNLSNMSMHFKKALHWQPNLPSFICAASFFLPLGSSNSLMFPRLRGFCFYHKFQYQVFCLGSQIILDFRIIRHHVKCSFSFPIFPLNFDGRRTCHVPKLSQAVPC